LFVGLAFLAVIVVATVNTFRTRDDGILGNGGVELGAPLPQFAAPDLRGSQQGDANVFQDDCGSSSNPCDDPRTPACQVDLPQVIRVCDLFDKPLVISFWFTGGANCLPTQDVVNRVASRYADQANFLSIDVRDDRDDARAIVAQRGWTIPVGYDSDGAVSNLYRVGGCPTVAFAYPGGIFASAKLGTGELTEQSLSADVDTLLRDSRLRAETDR
jgi:thiol-disulfide isomerase/thioredoxin